MVPSLKVEIQCRRRYKAKTAAPCKITSVQNGHFRITLPAPMHANTALWRRLERSFALKYGIVHQYKAAR